MRNTTIKMNRKQEASTKATKDVLSEKKVPLTVEDLYTAIGKNIEDSKRIS